MNPLVQLAEYGQSFWLDYIRRSFVEGGAFERMIEEDGLRGVTSNPSIFEKAIEGREEYEPELSAAHCDSIEDAKRVFEQIATHDIQAAADLLRPVYERTRLEDGYVSLEVSPLLAHDTQGTIQEARRLWQTVNRPNLLIKVPSTPEGLPAIETLLSEGINVNITLLFSRHVYRETAEAYLRALEARAGRSELLSGIASVASFFVSRIDTAVDDLLEEKLKTAPARGRRKIEALRGKTAIANAKLAYQIFREVFSGPRWEALKEKGARPQRVLWASTSTKNPAYRDVLYVEELIGPQTVNTMPPATVDAFRDHGRLRNSLEEDVKSAERHLSELEKLDISLDKVTADLVSKGVELFASAFGSLLGTIQKTAVAAKAEG
jgi:transaldolase/glucose-6-phosphate isomerase